MKTDQEKMINEIEMLLYGYVTETKEPRNRELLLVVECEPELDLLNGEDLESIATKHGYAYDTWAEHADGVTLHLTRLP